MYIRRSLLLFSSPIIRTAGQICAKSGALRVEHTGEPFQLLLALSYVLFIFRGVIWIFVLREFDLKLAYSVMALSYVGVLAAGHFLFGEAAGFRETIGALMITGGVVLIGFGESRLKGALS
jgi:multidrug transporter EmrE-like cation transporter